MKLTGIVLSGGDREDVLPDCLRSMMDVVDHTILIDTGPSAQKAVAVAREMLGDRCSVRVFSYSGEFDTATARNFALDCAAEAGYDIALMLDTDERLMADPVLVRRMLAEVTTETVMIRSDVDNYKKTKFFRLPRGGFWSARTHEAFVTGPATWAKGFSFSELPKTPEEHLRTQTTVERIAREDLEHDPNNARMRYYHGDALAALGRAEEAVDEFLLAAQTSHWVEEVDWSHFRAATTLGDLGRFGAALNVCLASSQRIPELVWYAAHCYLQLGEHELAAQWAHKAIEVGEFQRLEERAGFYDKATWYERPYEVLSGAYAAQGDQLMADDAIVLAEQQKRERLEAQDALDGPVVMVAPCRVEPPTGGPVRQWLRRVARRILSSED